MRTRAAVAFCFVLVVACGDVAIVDGDSDASQTPEMMAVAMVRLITVDNTFGGEPPPSTEYLALDRIDPYAGNTTKPPSEPTRTLTEGERKAIEDAISEYGPVRWIDDPNPTLDSAPDPDAFQMILGVGEPDIESDTGLVPVSMVCGNVCGTWFTYRLDRVDDQWVVTGIEGPVSIS